MLIPTGETLEQWNDIVTNVEWWELAVREICDHEGISFAEMCSAGEHGNFTNPVYLPAQMEYSRIGSGYSCGSQFA